MERGVPAAVRITEPGRTPLHLVVDRPVDVGRDCDGVLLADAELSRRHLRLSPAGSRVTVQDLGSTNGTKVDGSLIAGPTGVACGQVVTFGRCRMELVPVDGRDPASRADGPPRSPVERVAAAAAARGWSATSIAPGAGSVTVAFVRIDANGAGRRGTGPGGSVRSDLLAFHSQVVRHQVARWCGDVVEAEGEVCMLTFPGARAAVHCSIEMQRAFAVHARSNPASGLGVRIGMHAGEAVVDDGDLIGRPAGLASRITGRAAGGEILVSSIVHEIVGATGDVAFGPARRIELEPGDGIVHPVEWAESR